MRNVVYSSFMLTATLALGACDKAPARELAQARAEQARVQASTAKELDRAGVFDPTTAKAVDRFAAEQAARRDELDDKQALQRGEIAADAREKPAGEQHKVYRTAATVAAQRVDIETHARERLAKLDARARELTARTAVLAERAKVRVSSLWTAIGTGRAEIASRVRGFASVGDEQLSVWRDDLETRFDAVDDMLSQVESRLRVPAL